jgi:hypothetical protein
MSDTPKPAKPELSPRDAAIKKHLRRGHCLEAATRLADSELNPVPEVIPDIIPDVSPDTPAPKKKKQPTPE